MTGSTRAPQAPVQQAYPGDYAQVDQMSTGSVARGGGGILNRGRSSPRPQGNVGGGYAAQNPYPVQNAYPAQNAYPVAGQQPGYQSPARQAVISGPALAPVVTRSSLDSNPTGSVSAVSPAQQTANVPTAAPMVTLPQQQAPVQVAANDGGWSRAGGTQVSVKQGETVYNLSRRFGVPADAIMKANGLSSPNALAAGQQVVIPTYVHTARAPVSAPDANPAVADARSSTGTRFDPPAGGVPVPSKAPGERMAVLPPQPSVNDRTQTPAAAAGNNQNAGAPNAGAYTVASGDTLAAIARRHGTTTTALKQANGLNDGLIRIGQKLVIPAGGATATTQVAAAPKPATDATTTASVPAATNQAGSGAYTPPRQAADKVIQNASIDTTTPAPDASGISRMRWPARGRVISGFGASNSGKKNDGIDIAVPAGTPIRAAENGVVIYAGDGLKEFGNTVLVRHEDGLVTVYGHASKLNVQRGQKVRRGDEIALSGMSGSADSPKLHFEVRKDSTPVNPATYLE